MTFFSPKTERKIKWKKWCDLTKYSRVKLEVTLIIWLRFDKAKTVVVRLYWNIRTLSKTNFRSQGTIKTSRIEARTQVLIRLLNWWHFSSFQVSQPSVYLKEVEGNRDLKKIAPIRNEQKHFEKGGPLSSFMIFRAMETGADCIVKIEPA